MIDTWQLQDAKNRFSEVIKNNIVELLKQSPLRDKGIDLVARQATGQGRRPVNVLLDTCVISELVKPAPET